MIWKRKRGAHDEVYLFGAGNDCQDYMGMVKDSRTGNYLVPLFQDEAHLHRIKEAEIISYTLLHPNPEHTAFEEAWPHLWKLHTPRSDAEPVKSAMAIIDSGIMQHHPALRNNIWLTYDLTGEEPGDPEDQCGHGTIVALLACATSWMRCDLISIKITNGMHGGSKESLIRALRKLVELKQEFGLEDLTANLSAGIYSRNWWGRPCNGTCDVCQAAVETAAHGITLVTAAGYLPGRTACPATAGRKGGSAGIIDVGSTSVGGIGTFVAPSKISPIPLDIDLRQWPASPLGRGLKNDRVIGMAYLLEEFTISDLPFKSRFVEIHPELLDDTTDRILQLLTTITKEHSEHEQFIKFSDCHQLILRMREVGVVRACEEKMGLGRHVVPPLNIPSTLRAEIRQVFGIPERIIRGSYKNYSSEAFSQLKLLHSWVSFETHPILYGTLLQELGLVYANQSNNDLIQNRLQAIQCFNQALQYCLPQVSPWDYANISLSLGRSFHELKNLQPDGEENALQKAIDSYKNALLYFDPIITPNSYWLAETNLGAAYASLQSDRLKNLQKAISCFRKALTVSAPAISRYDYQQAQLYLDMAHSQLKALSTEK